MFGFFFSGEKNITAYSQVMNCDRERFKKFFHGMLARGIYFAPSAFEAGFVSGAHSDEHIDRTIKAAARVMKEL